MATPSPFATPTRCDFQLTWTSEPGLWGSWGTSVFREGCNAYWGGLGSWRERPWSATQTQASGWGSVGPGWTSTKPGSERKIRSSDLVWELLAPLRLGAAEIGMQTGTFRLISVASFWLGKHH